MRARTTARLVSRLSAGGWKFQISCLANTITSASRLTESDPGPPARPLTVRHGPRFVGCLARRGALALFPKLQSSTSSTKVFVATRARAAGESAARRTGARSHPGCSARSASPQATLSIIKALLPIGFVPPKINYAQFVTVINWIDMFERPIAMSAPIAAFRR
jgi:hypothetical protein